MQCNKGKRECTCRSSPPSHLPITTARRFACSTAFPPETISGKNIPPSPGFGSAGDVSGIYAYAVPMSGSGSTATPEYNQMPQPNSSCTGYASIGPLAVDNPATAASTTCNYLFIALSVVGDMCPRGVSPACDALRLVTQAFIYRAAPEI